MLWRLTLNTLQSLSEVTVSTDGSWIEHEPDGDAVLSALRSFAAEFDVALEGYLPSDDGSSQLAAAIAYSALAPGKRLRPYLVARCCEVACGVGATGNSVGATGSLPARVVTDDTGGQAASGTRGDANQSRAVLSPVRSVPHPSTGVKDGAPADAAVAHGHTPHPAMHVAAAVECVHAFSLIHDDLPAMDDDDLRRGRPTNHKVFGEANAILAGNALLSLAFELLVRHTPDARIAAGLVLELADAVGAAGMIGGQAADIAGQDRPPDLTLVESIHARKTARLMEAACRLGAMYGEMLKTEPPKAESPTLNSAFSISAFQRFGVSAFQRFSVSDIVETLGRYGRFLGVAFQITDDLLDVTATREGLGKEVGKDASSGKQTHPSCVGVEESRRAAARATRRAVEALASFGESAEDLRALARFVACGTGFQPVSSPARCRCHTTRGIDKR